jgi:serine/threonine protein kinase
MSAEEAQRSSSSSSSSSSKGKKKKRSRPKVQLANTGPPEIKPEEMMYFEKIGGGCYGNVYRGECRGKEVAIKKLFKQNLKPQTIAEFKKEVEICSRLHHPNVLLFMGACTKPRELSIVTELMPKGNLETVLRDEKAVLSLRRRMLYARDTALGMNWLHMSDPPIVHRDLKPSNLLLDKHGTVKVCDFGLSAIKLTEKLKDTDSIPGTPLWMAPEVLMGRELDEKCDVYSYGIVLWEIFTRTEPFPQFQSYREFKRAITVENVRPPIPEGCPESLARLMELCWDPDSEKRPSFAEVIPMLDVVIVDVTVSDEVGRKFWKRSFLGKEAVPWDEFSLTFAEYLNLPVPDLGDVQWKALHAIVAEPDDDKTRIDPPMVVNLERFGKVLSWFGPLEPRESASSFTILERVADALKQPWFHGDIARVRCEKSLSKKEPGTYLVRVSTTVDGAFTISKVSRNGKVNHQRIDFKPNKGFTIKIIGSSGSRIVAENCTLRAFITKIARDLHLQQPLQPWPYESIFVSQHQSDVEGYLVADDSDSGSDSLDSF